MTANATTARLPRWSSAVLVTASDIAPLAPVATATLEWHHDRARFLLDLDDMLDQAPAAAARRALLAQLTPDLAQ